MTTTTTEAFEAHYQRSAEDPASAEMLAIWEAAWSAATERAAKLRDEQIAHIRSVRNDSAEDMRREIAMLREFHSFFKDRCEFLYAHFGFAPLDLYNKCALNAAAIRASSGKGDCDV